MSGVGNREVAHRLFAAEYDDASLEYAESDEERAPNYVVTPTGARVNRLFVVGVLTSVEQVNEDTVRARIADPTGAFVVYAGQYQPDEHAALQSLDAPAFVAITGKANTFQPEGSDRVLTSIRPESVTEVDAESRDRWVVTATEHTLGRIATVADALGRDERGDDLAAALRGEGIEPGLAEGVARAIDHYATTADYLGALREVVIQAVEVVAGDREEAESLDSAPGEGTGQYTAGDLRTATPENASSLVERAVPPDDLVDGDEGGSQADEGESQADEGESQADESEAGAGEAEADASEDGTASEPETGTGAGDAEAGGSDTEAADGVSAPEESAVEGSATEKPAGGKSDAGADAGADTGADDEEHYEVDEAERERIEEEYGVGFESASEVDEPGEAGIETEADPGADPDPEPDATAEPEADEVVGESGGEPDDGSEDEADDADDPVADDADDPVTDDADDPVTDDADDPVTDDADDPEADDADDPEADVEDDPEADDADDPEADVEDVLIEEMAALDEGDGADRAALIETVSTETGADPDAVDDAIDDALMGGKCYEPSEGTLKPI